MDFDSRISLLIGTRFHVAESLIEYKDNFEAKITIVYIQDL